MAAWTLVKELRDRLRALDLSGVETDLSAAGLAEAWAVALDALTDADLDRAASEPGTPFGTACLVTTGTVPTAALEWLALLLGRGSKVVWKHPAGRPGLAAAIQEVAGPLPLRISGDRAVVAEADLVIALGSDAAIAAIRAAARPGAVVYGHGHAWSMAWVTGRDLPPDPRIPADFQDPWGRVAADAALFDGRGCLSPSLVLTSVPLDEACAALGAALARAQDRWPVGVVHPSESAMIRSRRAMTRVVGTRAQGEGWSVHGLTTEHIAPIALPRSLALAWAPDAESAARCAASWGRSLSTVGTDDWEAARWFFAAGATRVCTTGRMQRPPLDRVHDGTRILDQTLRRTGVDSR